jgi:magnesium and cobalt transporter
MGETTDGQPETGPLASEDEDPDSPGAPSFLSRLFGRDDPQTHETANGSDSPSAAAASGAREMLVGLQKMLDSRVDDVSVPRADIIAVAQETTLEELLGVFRRNTVSRLPVYAEALDEPLGLVHVKDLALKYGFGAPQEGFDLNALLRPLLYAPPSMPIGVLLQKMQATRIHMALVIDEYGGVDGLVTIEDLLEQIVGEIADEHDEAESQLWTREEPGVYLAQARVELEEFEAETGVALADAELDEETDTLGGLVSRLSGRVPVRGEVVMHPDGHEFEITDADARKIKRIRVRLRSALNGRPVGAAL